MPDESDFKDYKSIEEYMKTLEGNTYYHGLLLRAVNHPVRREILSIISKAKKTSKADLFNKLKLKKIINNQNELNYNLDYLVKALCITPIQDKNFDEVYYEITLSGQVVDYL